MNRFLPAFLIALTLGVLPLPAQLKKIGVSDVKPTPALVEANRKAGKLNSLERVVQALDGQMIAAVHGTRRFEVIARSDLASLLQEAGLAGRPMQVAGVDYLLVTSVDDFQDFTETATFAALGKTATRRIIQFSAVARIYESDTGKLIETANFQISNRDARENLGQTERSGDLSDALLVSLTRDMAERVARRVADVIFPARIVSRIDRQVTINRGDGTGIQAGQVWGVFALGQEMIDPDTGVSLGREE